MGAKHPRKKRPRNGYARAALARKGGVHKTSKKDVRDRTNRAVEEARKTQDQVESHSEKDQ